MNETNSENQTKYPTKSEYRKRFLRANKKNIISLSICFIALVILLSIIIISAATDSDDYLNYENYAQIQNGMTYHEVVEALDNHIGRSNKPSQRGSCVYTWEDSSGSRRISVSFDENGIVYNKSQYGLD